METVKETSKSIKKSTKKVIVLGVFLAVLGVAALVYPGTAGNITSIAIGAFLFIGGVLRLAAAPSSISWKVMALGVFSGMLMGAAGLWVMANPDMGLDALTILVASYFVVDGITQIAMSFKLQPIGGGSYLLFNGLISTGLGVLVFAKFPESSFYFIGIYVGLKLIMDGLIMIATGKKIAHFAKTTGESVEEFKQALQDEIDRVAEEEEARNGQAPVTHAVN